MDYGMQSLPRTGPLVLTIGGVTLDGTWQVVSVAAGLVLTGTALVVTSFRRGKTVSS